MIEAFLSKKICHPLNSGDNWGYNTPTHSQKGSDKLYPQIITYLLTLIKYQDQIIRLFLRLLIGKNMFDKSKEQPVNQPYRKSSRWNELPVIETFQKLDYKTLMKEYSEEKR